MASEAEAKAQLPVVDFAAFLDPSSTAEEKAKVARDIDQACRDVGFFYLKNHGVPRDLIAELLALTRDFFETATPTEKARLAMRGKHEGGDHARGWLKVVSPESGTHEVSNLSSHVNPKEYYTHAHSTAQALDIFRPVETKEPPYETGRGPNHWPETPTQFRPVAEAYIEHLEGLGKKVMQAIAMALAVDERIFLDRIDKAFWNLRILGYEGRKEKREFDAGIGQHTGAPPHQAKTLCADVNGYQISAS
jgi:isopenicillin N synthase-like dioxygenase